MGRSILVLPLLALGLALSPSAVERACAKEGARSSRWRRKRFTHAILKRDGPAIPGVALRVGHFRIVSHYACPRPGDGISLYYRLVRPPGVSQNVEVDAIGLACWAPPGVASKVIPLYEKVFVTRRGFGRWHYFRLADSGLYRFAPAVRIGEEWLVAPRKARLEVRCED